MTIVNRNGSVLCAGAVNRNGIITEVAPILRKFLNQPVGNLVRWVKSKKGTVRGLRMNQSLCAKCNICQFLPKQKRERVLELESTLEDEPAKHPVLFIDDAPRGIDALNAMKVAKEIASGKPFSYTQTIRCDHVVADQTEEQMTQALEHCSVWTHSLLEDRAVVVTTVSGLHQMRIGADKKVGDLFISPKVGMVLVISPLLSLSPEGIRINKTKLDRAKKEIVGLYAKKV